MDKQQKHQKVSPMIKIFNEKIIVENVAVGERVRPSQSCLLLIQRGRIELEVNNKRTKYKSSDLVLFSPMKMYKLIYCSKDIQAYFLLYDREKLNEQINVSFSKFSVVQLMNMEQNKDVYTLSEETFGHFWKLIEQIDYYIKNPNFSKFVRQIIVHSFTLIAYMFVDILIQNSSLNAIHTSSRKETITMDFIHLLSTHFRKERELKFYASKLFISIKYLSICVKEVTGITPQVLISNILMDEARLLLINTDLNISIIADHLNFSDQYAFGKFFKKHSGLSPRNFRKNISTAHTI